MKEIISTNGFAIKVDDADFDLVSQHKWYAFLDWKVRYARTTPRKKLFMHRIILNAPKGTVVDHINGDGLDNRKENLRLCTVSQNACNTGSKKNSSSKYKGVTALKNSNKWQASIKISGKSKYLGLFINEEDAAKAYDRESSSAHGEFARLNFPKKDSIP